MSKSYVDWELSRLPGGIVNDTEQYFSNGKTSTNFRGLNNPDPYAFFEAKANSKGPTRRNFGPMAYKRTAAGRGRKKTTKKSYKRKVAPKRKIRKSTKKRKVVKKKGITLTVGTARERRVDHVHYGKAGSSPCIKLRKHCIFL